MTAVESTPGQQPAIDAPRSPYKRTKPTRTNFELYAWLFMRMSGVLLIVLIFGHLIVNLVLGRGIQQVDFAFVAGKYQHPYWKVWDLAMLWLAMLHGTNGVRTIINDYTDRNGTRFWLKMLLYLAFTATVLLGTLVIFTFDPCPANATAGNLPSFCSAVR